VPVTLTGGNFQNPLGTVISGTLVMLLNQDAHITAGGHAAPRAVTLTVLNGNISGSYSIYASNELQPSGTYYVVTLIDTNSNLAYGPERWLLTAPGPIDVGTISPLEDVVIFANSIPAPTEVSLAPSAPGNFTVAHGLGRTPVVGFVQMTSGGEIWFQTSRYDVTNLYLTASAGGITGKAELW